LVTVIGCAILGYGQKIYQQRKEALEKRKTNSHVLNFFELHNLLPELTTLQKQDCKEVLHKLSSLHQQTIAKTHQYAVALIVGLCGGISLVAGGLGAGAGFIAFGYGLLVLSAAVAAFTLGAHWNDGTHQRQTYQEIQNLVNRLLSKTPFTNGNNPPPTIPVAIAVPLHQTGTEIEMTPTILPEVPTTPIYLAQQPTAPPLSKELVTA